MFVTMHFYAMNHEKETFKSCNPEILNHEYYNANSLPWKSKMGEKYSIVWHSTSIKHAEDKMSYDLLFVFGCLRGFTCFTSGVEK
jgi:hypothetical protein